jgi:energy-coupling factor transport system substrate-specific component
VLAALVLCAYFRVESAALLTAAMAVVSLLPFFLRYELQKPRPRDIMPIVVLAASRA